MRGFRRESGFFIAVIFCLSNASASSQFSVDLGWALPNLPGVQLPGMGVSSEPDLERRYYVLSETGGILFQAKLQKENAPGSNAAEDLWVAVPGDKTSRSLPYFPIVIGSLGSMQLQPVQTDDVHGAKKYLEEYWRDLGRKLDLSDYERLEYVAGRNGSRTRVVVLLQSKSEDSTFGTMVGLLDVGEHVADELVSFSSEHDSSELVGVVDTDGDGLADVVVTHHGDFDGFRILRETDGQWKLQRDDWPRPD